MKILPVLCAGMLLTGCSSYKPTTFISSSNVQTIEINTPEAFAATCDVTAGEKNFRVVTPGDFKVVKPKTGESFNVTCMHSEFETVSRVIEPRVSTNGWWTVLNKNVYQTGTNKNPFEYPNVINIKMNPIIAVEDMAPVAEFDEGYDNPFSTKQAPIDFADTDLMTETEAIDLDVVLEPMVKVGEPVQLRRNRNLEKTISQEVTIPEEKLVPRSFSNTDIDMMEPMDSIGDSVQNVETKSQKGQDDMITFSDPTNGIAPDNQNKGDGSLSICKAGFC